MGDNKIAVSLFRNAIVFLKEAIRHLNAGIEQYHNMVLAIVNIQMAVELAIKYCIADKFGEKTIFENVPRDISEENFTQMFVDNKLCTKEFEKLKNFLKSKEEYSRLLSDEFAYMDKFQLYRNKFVHLNYHFRDGEMNSIASDMLHVITHILHILLSGQISQEEYREFLYEYMDHDEYQKLLSIPEFHASLEKKLKSEYSKLYFCPMCDKKLVTPYKKCVGCLFDFYEPLAYGFVPCAVCGEEMVIYDAQNIAANHELRGVCLNCENDAIVYWCGKCGRAVNLELPDSSQCKPGYCEYK